MGETGSYVDANAIQRLLRSFAASGPGSWLFARILHHIDRPVYRLTRGRHTFASLVSGLPVAMPDHHGRPQRPAPHGAGVGPSPLRRPGGDRLQLRAGTPSVLVLQPPRQPHRGSGLRRGQAAFSRDRGPWRGARPHLAAGPAGVPGLVRSTRGGRCIAGSRSSCSARSRRAKSPQDRVRRQRPAGVAG